MPLIVVVAEERSVLFATAPSHAEIVSAFDRARIPGDASHGRWIGGGPRVTRYAKIGERFPTFAVGVYGWPVNGFISDDGAPSASMVAELLGRVRRELNSIHLSHWVTIGSLPYSEGANGPLSWWECHNVNECAQNTRTHDDFPTELGRIDAKENPFGPDSPLTHVTSPAEAYDRARRAAQESASTLTDVLKIAAVIVVPVALAKVINDLRLMGVFDRPKQPAAEKKGTTT